MERRIIKANKGMILTDGETYGTTIYLGEDADETKFKEITLEEYEKISAEENNLEEIEG